MAGRLESGAMGALHRFIERSSLFYYLRVPTYWGTMQRMREALALRDGERLLDVGCGTGMAAVLARGLYVGVDTTVPYLAFAQRRVADAACHFVAMSALELAFADNAFDKAVVINMVHHLDEPTVDALLVQLTRVVRGKVVLLDAAPDAANRFERFLLRHDRGHYIRERDALRAILARHFTLRGEEVFHNTVHTVPQVMFHLEPRDAGSRSESAVR